FRGARRGWPTAAGEGRRRGERCDDPWSPGKPGTPRGDVIRPDRQCRKMLSKVQLCVALPFGTGTESVLGSKARVNGAGVVAVPIFTQILDLTPGDNLKPIRIVHCFLERR